MAESKAKEAEEKRRREEELRRQLEAVRDELTDGLESCHESIKEYQAEVAELSENCGSAERRNAAMAEDLRVAKGWSALYEIEMRKLEEELEVEVKVSVGCDPDERIDGDVNPWKVDPEELRHYVALQRQYGYLGVDNLCKIPGFSGVLRRTRLRSPRGLAESFKTQTEEAKAKGAVKACIASVQTEAMGQSDAQSGELVATKEVLSWLENLFHVASSKGMVLSCEKVLPLLRSKMEEAEAFAENAVETSIASVQTEAKCAVGYQGDRAGVRYDDWYCHRCEYKVFAKRSKCPKCGRARSV